jgi:jouberin
MDQNVLHPFVRIHIVDLKSHKYLAKSKPNQPGVANKESCSFFKIDQAGEGENKDKKDTTKIAEYSDVNFFLPLSTTMYDLRVGGNNFCEWNEDFIINENLEQIYQENVVIMFEILDFVP